MVSFHVFGLQECYFRRRKETEKKKKKSVTPVNVKEIPSEDGMPQLNPRYLVARWESQMASFTLRCTRIRKI